jgi:hypothetical protein
MTHWTAEGKTEEQLRPRYIDGEWYLHVSDCHNALGERDVARQALRDLADEAAKAVCEPARFDQHDLGLAVARARRIAGGGQS